jgi:hypothetical protein
VGLQVFQHGDRAACHAHVLAAQELVAPGGVMAVRVNAVGTDIEFDHEVIEEEEEGSGLTVRYLQGPKRGLLVHFFDRTELEGLFDRFDADLPIRRDRTRRPRPGAGQWSQWEAIWVRRRETAGT